jgi:hypothetical protein
MSCSQKFMEVSMGTMHLPARWSVKPFGMDFTGLQLSRTPSSWSRPARHVSSTPSRSTHRHRHCK